MSLESFLQKRNSLLPWRVASHLLFWTVFYSASAYYNQIALTPLKSSLYGYLEPIYNTISLAIVFYTLIYLVFPKFVFKQKWLPFTLSILLLSVLFAVTVYIGESLMLTYCDSCKATIGVNTPYYLEYMEQGFPKVMMSRLLSLGIFLQMLVNLMIPLAIKGGLSYHQSYVRNLELAQNNVQLELSFLKAQLNPHFLFNTLNNLYGLIIQEQTDKSAQTVSRLSDFMRYTLYDSSNEYVPLKKELELIQNYLELEALRLNNTEVKFTQNLDDSVQQLPPLLFLPLIENAFKYVNDDAYDSYIHIEIRLYQSNLSFKISNSFNPEEDSNRIGGIGLQNFQKRLALYFSEKYQYHCEVKDRSYNAHLNLNFL